MKARDHANEWLKYSHTDLDSGLYLMKMIPAPLEIICVHCQQSAEKAMKSILADLDHDIPRIHDLLKIQVLLRELVPGLEFRSDDVKTLNS